MQFTKEFEQYCQEISKNHNITIINLHEWCRSLKSKGWNQFEIFLNVFISTFPEKEITTDALIDLYKANIRLRNKLYKYSLFIEEYFKSWLFYNGWDKNNKLNSLMIGKLLKKVSQAQKQMFLNELDSIDKNDIEIEEIYNSWREIRNSACHRSIKILLDDIDLFKKIHKMLLLLDNIVRHQKSEITVREKAIREIQYSLEYIEEFVQVKWKEDAIWVLNS